MTQDRTLLEMLRAQVRHGGFKLASGRLSHYYLDARQVTLTPGGLLAAAEDITEVFWTKDVRGQAIGGPAAAALPLVGACLAIAAAREWSVVGFYTLKAPKDHGTRQQVHGPVTAGMKAVLIDDVATSGGSLLESARAVRDLGATVDTAICLVDRLEGACDALQAEGITLLSLFTVRDLGVEPVEP
jgi:orotate phosphoribosyltransferase